jgi:hypothetical protein
VKHTNLTRSEKLTSSICERAFLRLWTHPNPKGKKGKELCDCLVICGLDVVIISVKEIAYKDTGDSTGWERWQRAAIDESAQQIFGAERWLNTVDEIVRRDNQKVSLPPKGQRKYHRIAVALGGQGQVPMKWGDLGNGFVLVVDEQSLDVLFSEFDTVSDLSAFLNACESLLAAGSHPLFAGAGLEDLIAIYLQHDHSFNLSREEIESETRQADIIVLSPGLWNAYRESEEYRGRRENLNPSYVWDRLIEHFVEDHLSGGMFNLFGNAVSDAERALARMAIQPRAFRANIAESLLDFLDPQSKIASRIINGAHETAFLFLAGNSSDREHRARELMLRCLVARGRFPNTKTVVGIATDRPGSSKVGYSSDIVYVDIPEWSPELEKQVAGIQKDLGYFLGKPVFKGSEEEFQ